MNLLIRTPIDHALLIVVHVESSLAGLVISVLSVDTIGDHFIHAHEVVFALPEPHHDLLPIPILTRFPFLLRIANPAPIGKPFYALLPGNMYLKGRDVYAGVHTNMISE